MSNEEEEKKNWSKLGINKRKKQKKERTNERKHIWKLIPS